MAIFVDNARLTLRTCGRCRLCLATATSTRAVVARLGTHTLLTSSCMGLVLLGCDVGHTHSTCDCGASFAVIGIMQRQRCGKVRQLEITHPQRPDVNQRPEMRGERGARKIEHARYLYEPCRLQCSDQSARHDGSNSQARAKRQHLLQHCDEHRAGLLCDLWFWTS